VTGAIVAGERILLEGSSGSGKSTLVTVLAGLRSPDGGELWFAGQPRGAVIDDRWRRGVVLVPQFHDNHVLGESLLFNLLLGRGWPPTAADERDAAAVCDLLGLTPLIERMPQGLQQTVGEGGWTLSHGERGRVFLARALLQRDAALVILDESFSALDPETLQEISRGVLAAAPTLLVITHR
jgi:ATP-binding cassette, subfamily B, bacterial